MFLSGNTSVCDWKLGSSDPPILGPSEFDYVTTRRPAAIMLKTGDYPQKVYDSIPDWAKENDKLELLWSVGMANEDYIEGSHEYGFETAGEYYWCSPLGGFESEESSDLWPLVAGLGIGSVAGLALAVFAPARPLSKGGTIAASATAGFMGLLGGLVWNAYKNGEA